MLDRVKVLGIIISHQLHKPESRLKKIRKIFIASLFLTLAVIIINFFDFKILRNAYAATITSGLGEIFEKQENRDMYKFLKSKTGDRRVAGLILKYSKEYNVDEILLLSLIKAESKLDPDAIGYNRDGSIDRGLCQLNSRTFKDIDEKLFFEPEVNIRLGAEYLNWCLKKSGNNTGIALMYYNAGFGNVANNNVGKKTYGYITKIINQKKKYDREFVKTFL